MSFINSGVVTILFAGIAARRYVNKNISDPLKVIASYLFQLLSYLSETSCFLLLVSIFLNDLPTYNAAFISGTANAVPVLISFCQNALAQCSKNGSSQTYPNKAMKHMIFLAGLRGAVAYALANLFPDLKGQVVASTEGQQEGDGRDRLGYGWLGGVVTDFERRYVYPCVLRNNATHDSTDRPTTEFSETMISGSSEMMTAEEGHRDLDSCSETSSGGGSVVASPNDVVLAVVDVSPAPELDCKISPLMLDSISSTGSNNKRYAFKHSTGSGGSFDSSQKSSYYNVRKAQPFSPQGQYNMA
eukprot:gene28516-37470_t